MAGSTGKIGGVEGDGDSGDGKGGGGGRRVNERTSTIDRVDVCFKLRLPH